MHSRRKVKNIIILDKKRKKYLSWPLLSLSFSKAKAMNLISLNFEAYKEGKSIFETLMHTRRENKF